MPPSRTQINCPNCRRPIQADVQQLFDTNVEPTAKQRLLSGGVNLIQCPFCGYQGNLSTPIVYHDPQKELLLTFVPTELGMPRNEQERLVGSLINRVMNDLPQERRKAYLLKPETTLTFQRLMERILEADGITSEMIQAQQERLALLQRLMNASEEARPEIVQQELALLDAEFFSILARLLEASAMSGDQQSARGLQALQEQVLPLTPFGQEMQEQVSEIEAAYETLQEAGDGLTRDKLLELIQAAPSETRRRALVSLTRPALDYTFFQVLSEKIERTQGEDRQRLTDLREQLLNLTQEIDRQIEARLAQARQLLNGLLRSADIQEATLQNLPAVDEFFVQVLNSEIQAARQNSNRERLDKLQRVVAVLQQASAPPPEVAFIQDLIEAPDEKARRTLMESNPEEITPQLLETLAAMISQAQAGEDQELVEQLRAVNRMAVRMSMQANLKG